MQSPRCPMPFMLGCYDCIDSPAGPAAAYPKRFVIDSFRAYRRVEASLP